MRLSIETILADPDLLGTFLTLGKIPKFHLNSWYKNFVEMHSFHCGTIHPKFFGNCPLPQTFHSYKLGEIMVFYAV